MKKSQQKGFIIPLLIILIAVIVVGIIAFRLHGGSFAFLKQSGVASVSLSTGGSSTTYYVSLSGSDSNSGTSESSPWKTIGKVNATTLVPGDTVLFQGGQVFSGNLRFGSGDGDSATVPVTIGSYNGRATISAGTGIGALVLNTGGIWFENLKFVGAPAVKPGGAAGEGFEQSGIAFQGYKKGVYYSNNEVDNTEISGFRTAGIIVEAGYADSGIDGLRITNNNIHDNVDSGIQSDAADYSSIKDLYVGHNQVYDNYGDGYSVCTGSGIMLGGVSDTVVEYNQAYHNGAVGGNGGVGIWTYSSNNVTFQYNESYDNKTTRGEDGDGMDFDADTSNSVMQYNLSYGNDGGGALLDQWHTGSLFNNDIIRYNILQGNGRNTNYGDIEIWGKVLTSYVYNNVIYSTPNSHHSNYAIRIHNSSIPGLYVSDVHIANNIFETTGGVPLAYITAAEATGMKDLTFTGNVFWGSGSTPEFIDGGKSYSSFSDWQSAGREEWGSYAYGTYGDPQFKNPGTGAAGSLTSSSDIASAGAGYQIQSGSAALSQALNISDLYSLSTGGRDFFGNSIASSVTTVAGIDQSSRTNGTPVTVTTSTSGGGGTVIPTAEVGSGSSDSVLFVSSDSTTSGSWKTNYGSDGYFIHGDEYQSPSYVSLNISGESDYTWSASTESTQALQKETGYGRIASCWYTTSPAIGSTFTIDVNIKDGKAHEISLYALDWDKDARNQHYIVEDAITGAPLDARFISNFEKGVYTSWIITGHVKIVVTNDGPSNAVVDGIFFEPAPTPVTATISGPGFNDAKKNGVYDAGDTPLSGWGVWINANVAGQPDPVGHQILAGANGTYAFSNLIPGTYIVDEEIPNGYARSVPTTVMSPGATGYTITVAANQVVTGKNFGSYLK
jgi:hypothetical protein